jgi:regulator of protease activity HflC (stomatin/prohibitin superfamily)
VIKESEASRQQQINEAEGQAQAILAIAGATAEGIRKVAEAISAEGGVEAVQLRVAEQYVEQFGHLAKVNNTVILPATLSDVGSMVAAAMNVLRGADPGRNVAAAAHRTASPAPMPPRPPHGRPLP